jgi:hypothetical protein
MWHGIMKIFEITQSDSKGNIIFKENNILNLLHNEGEEFILRAAFAGGQVSMIIPENYFLGLDGRTTIDVLDTIDSLIAEPTSGGYQRQIVSSSGDFSINFENDHYVAVSPIVTFRATSGSWGPVRNLFLTDKINNSGFLISSVPLSSAIFLSVGDIVTMRIGMQLKDCP